MWVERNPQEVARWNETTLREARSNGMMIAGAVWILGSLLAAGGWIISGKGLFMVQNSVVSGSFWVRLAIIAAITLPFAFWLFRGERNRSFRAASQMVICPKCETTRESNSEAPCECGGTFVPQSTVKWVEDEQPGSTVE